MASTFTTNSGIEKPGSGEQAGAWGTTVNTNFDIIDRVLNGVVTLSLTGTTTTLTTTDGALSDGHYKVLVLSGSPSGTNTITVTPNDQSKLYLVNNTTSQSVVFTQGSGGNVTILAGASAWIYGDGAGSGAQVRALPSDVVGDTTPQLGGDLDVNGNSIVSVSNGNIAITPNGSGKVVLDGLSYPTADGTNGQYLQTDGSGSLSFSTVPISGSTFTLGDWTLSVVSNELVFSYTSGGTTTKVAKIGTNGAITSANDVSAFGTV
tara:strand:+ start:322 stop:1110 length:789 start_codon:yes stop_codon:yes gene_type:complete